MLAGELSRLEKDNTLLAGKLRDMELDLKCVAGAATLS